MLRALAVRRKRRAELGYWRERLAVEGTLANHWYERAFTVHAGLDREFYAGKRILDVGCGPRGSLEWARDAARRVGLDPLADSYRALHRRPQGMEYVAAPSERMPFADGDFDVVASWNSLDHVENLAATAAEMRRVLAPGGTLILSVMTGHAPTAMEPHELGWDCTGLFAPPLRLVDERRYEDAANGGLYEGLDAGVAWDESDPRPRVGLLVARFEA